MAKTQGDEAVHVQLARLEDVLSTAQRWAIEEAKALREIRDKKLYRVTHETFEAYGAERWGYDRAHMYRLCSWAEVIEAVSPIGCAPQRESHARPLYGLTADQQRQIWHEAESRLGRTKTAEGVEALAKAFLAPARSQNAFGAAQVCDGQVVHGDALTLVKELREKSVGCALFSPPYALQRASHYPSIAEADFPSWMASLMDGLKLSLKEDASVLIVGREHIRDGSITDAWIRARLAIREVGYHEIDTLIWHSPDKPPVGRADRPRRTFEFVYWFSLSKSPYIDTRACGTPLKEPRKRMARHRGKEIYGNQTFQAFPRRWEGSHHRHHHGEHWR